MQCDQYPCKYCYTSCAIRRKRTTFKPDEPATTFVSLRDQQCVDGLFLSSGIVPDANTTMEKMLATVEIRMADASRLKRVLYRMCLRQGRRVAPRRMAGRLSLGDRVVVGLCEVLVFRALREKLGMSRVRVPLSGAR